MSRLPRKSGLIPNLLLAALLLSAQFGSLHADHTIVPAGGRFLAEYDTGAVSSGVIVVHQRGPPLPL